VALGVLPGTGGTQRLTRLLGKARALELMVRGATCSFEEAHGMGLVTQLLEGDDFRGQVRQAALGFATPGKAARAVGLIKRAVQTGAEVDLDSGLALERELQQQLFTSDDAREGLAAYLEKRQPQFSGR
jgi:enoyl-CoA hydratase